MPQARSECSRCTHTPKYDVVSCDSVTGLPLDLEEGQLELLVCERLDLAALIADEMMVVFAVPVDRLETRRPGADVDPLDEAILGELFEGAIHTCDADAATFRAQPVEDLLGGEATVFLATEQLDDRAASARFESPWRADARSCRLPTPAVSRERSSRPDDSHSHLGCSVATTTAACPGSEPGSGLARGDPSDGLWDASRVRANVRR